ncbi:MAG: phenylalanine--tRNA ligase subunit alpha [Mycoplasmatales bacterium]
MDKKFNQIRTEFNETMKNIVEEQHLIEVRNKFFSKNGVIAGLMKDIKHVENKQEYGKQVNDLKEELLHPFEQLVEKFQHEKMMHQMKKSAIDVTRPGKKIRHGKQSILLATSRKIEQIFEKYGFELVVGPEVETEYYNFEAVNLGKDHPARDTQDTLFVGDELVLRTHTSNVQSRTLENNPNKVFKIICPGKVYRRDDDDATHSHQFMQVEGLVIVPIEESYQDGSLRALKEVLTAFCNEFFERDDLEIRLRSSYFPFTEPSVEIDVTCANCLGNGCRICKNTGWIEILGSGVCNKRILEIAGFDSTKYSGYAFGLGVERMAMLKHNIEDIRHFYINDMRFLEQFEGEQC